MGSILRVGPPGTQTYDSITEAEADAQPGDVILVFRGTYNENVTVDVSNLVIMAFEDDVIMDGQNQEDQAFEITAENVTISGFIIQNYALYGIFVDDTGARIVGNIISNIISDHDDGDGIYINDEKNLVYKNMIHNTTGNGINVNSGESNWIVENHISKTLRGIVIDGDQNNAVIKNTLVNNNEGIFSHYGNTLMLYNRIYNNATNGIQILQDEDSPVLENNIHNNGTNGIYIKGFESAYLEGNCIQDNQSSGIRIAELSNFNVVINNTVRDNKADGIRVQNDDNFDNTFIRNTVCNNYPLDLNILETDFTAIDNQCNNSNPPGICERKCTLDNHCFDPYNRFRTYMKRR